MLGSRLLEVRRATTETMNEAGRHRRWVPALAVEFPSSYCGITKSHDTWGRSHALGIGHMGP